MAFLYSTTSILKETDTHLPQDAALDLIRVFAAFSVIVVHMAHPIANNFDAGSINWWVANGYEAFFRSGIPLFLMLSGALLLPRATGLAFVYRRILRVMLPLLLWVVVYVIAKLPLAEIKPSDFISFLYNGFTYHLWYVYVIVFIYCLMPLLKQILDRWEPRTLTMLIVTCCATVVLKTAPFHKLTADVIIYLLYVLVGCTLYKHFGQRAHGNMALGFLLFFAGVVVAFFGTYFASTSTGALNQFFYQSTTLHVFLKALGACMVLTSLSATLSIEAKKVLQTISRLSFGIYLIHPLVLEHVVIVRLGVTPHTLSPLVGIIITSLLCFACATLLLYVLSKLPLGRYTY